MIATRGKRPGGNRKTNPKGPGKTRSGPDSMARSGNPSMPGGNPNRSPIAPKSTGAPESALATVSLLVLRQIDAKASTVASTLDAAAGSRTRARREIDPQLLERTQAYLRSLRAGREPGAALSRAWEEFYRLHRPVVRRVVGACRLSAQDAEDCIQEAWIAIIRALPHFRYDPREGRFCCWMLRLVRNRVIDFLRSLHRGPNTVIADVEETVCCRSLDPPADCEQGRRRLAHCVLAQLQKRVSATSYDVVYLRWIEGCDVRNTGARIELV